MTPNVRYRPGQKIQPAPPPPPAPSPNEGKTSGPVLKITDDSPLVKLLQNSGRSPTHPLTAKAAPALKKVTPVDVQKSEQALRQAEVHAERGRLEETYKSLEKAYSLNPDSEKIVDALHQVLSVGGQATLAHGLLTEFLDRHPESIGVRALRLNLSKQLIGQLQFLAEKFPQDERFAKDAMGLSALAIIDQALILRSQAPSIRQELKAFESNSEKIHGMDFESKAKILDSIQMTSESLLELGSSRIMADPEGQPIAQELKTLAKELSDALLRFVESDSDPKLRVMIPIAKAKQALAEGRLDDALVHFEAYREAECKILGNGDAGKGFSSLKEKYEAASALMKNNHEAEAEKAVEGISPNLLLAHRFIEEAGAAKLRQANLAALAAWREEIIAEAQSQRENVGALDNAWDKIWRPEVTEADKILKSETIRLNLVSAVRARLESGKVKTIMEALKDVYAGSDAELKDAALEVMATSGLVMPFGSSRAGRLAAFGSSTQPDAESSAQLLKDAKELSEGNDEQKKAAAGIYRMVHLLSRDASHKEEARQALEAK